MGRKILFTPVGGTDPMPETNDRDGALLHIARHYRPDIIYMYMSKEILKKQEEDDRYRYCLARLAEWLEQRYGEKHTFEIRLIERPELVRVQLFEPIYADFENLLHEITASMDSSDELLLNISSGTPSMKSALLVLATMVDIPCKCIQVDTPRRSMNDHLHSKLNGFMPELRWEMNEDNICQPGDENYNRTHEETLISLKRLKYEAIIKKYVKDYNYHAAVILAESLRPEDTQAYLKKLRLADARKQLNFYRVNELLAGENAKIYSPVRADGVRTVYEYMLSVRARVKSNEPEYADFLRAISPLIADLFEAILRKQAHFHLADYTVPHHNVATWDMMKLQAPGNEEILKILNAAYGSFRGGWVKSDHLAKLIAGLVEEAKIRDCVSLLRQVEESVRNIAAHNMVSVSDEWVEATTGYRCDKILGFLEEAFTYTPYNIMTDYWNSYDAMSQDIIDAMDG